MDDRNDNIDNLVSGILGQPGKLKEVLQQLATNTEESYRAFRDVRDRHTDLGRAAVPAMLRNQSAHLVRTVMISVISALARFVKEHPEIESRDIPGELYNILRDDEQAYGEAIFETSTILAPQFVMFDDRYMQEKIDMKVDTSALEQEIATHEKQLRQYHATKSKLIDEIDSLDPDDKHYIPRKADLDERLYRMYDKIEETETLLIDARAKKRAIEADKVKGDNIYRILTHFDKLYDVMSDSERQELMQALIAEIHIHEQPQPNGQWLKSIRFRLPIIDGDTSLVLDKCDGVETVVLMSHKDT